MKPSFFNVDARINEKAFRFASRLLVAVMLACAAQTFVSLLGHIYLGWNPWYLSLAAFLVALACLANYTRLRKFEPLGSEWVLHFGALWLVILAGLRLITGLSRGLDSFIAELPLWPQGIEYILPNEFILAVFLAVSVWFLADYFAELLAKLDLDYVRLQREWPDPTEAAQRPARDRLLTLILNIGITLVILTALMRLDLRAAGNSELVILQLPPLSGGGLSTLLYFMLGLALFSLTQFMDLQARWSLNGVPVSGDLAGRWAQYSLVFLLILAALAALLPTNYSMGFLSVVGYGLRFLMMAGFFIVQLLFAFFVLLVNLIFSIFNREPPLEEAPAPEPELFEFFEPESIDPTLTSVTPPWIELLRQVFFWVFLIGVVLFAVRQVLLQNQEAIDGLRRIRFFGFLADFFNRLRGFFERAAPGC